MLSGMIAATVHHRRPILVIESVLAAVLVGIEAWTRAFGLWLFLGVIALAGACLVLVMVVQRRHRPAFLTVRSAGPSFDTPVSPFPVLLFTVFAGMAAVNLTSAVRTLGEREELWELDAAILGLYLAALAISFHAAWDHIGVRLRPDGVLDRSPAGSLFVPWEAFDLAYPAWPADRSDRLLLNYEGRARRRGIVVTGRRAMSGANVDRRFLARAIHHYVNHPEDRAAIGAETGYRARSAG